MKIISRITGGRPMRRGDHVMVDRVTGEDVYYYTDKFDREWLACGAWALFRVPVPISKKIRNALLLDEQESTT